MQPWGSTSFPSCFTPKESTATAHNRRRRARLPCRCPSSPPPDSPSSGFPHLYQPCRRPRGEPLRPSPALLPLGALLRRRSRPQAPRACGHGCPARTGVAWASLADVATEVAWAPLSATVARIA
jgi:hypothetical protein